MTLIARYKLDSDVKDTGPNGYHGTNNGVTFVSGKINNAGDFEASESDHVDILETISKTFTAISICCWVKANTKTSDMGIIYLRDAANADRFNFYYKNTTGKIHLYVKNDSGNLDLNSTIDLSTTEFQYILATYDGTTTKLYINNVEKTSSTTISGDLIFTGAQNHAIGSQGGGGKFFDGLIDDVRIYDHVLDANERRRLFRYSGYNEIVINAIDYSEKSIDWEFEKASTFFAGDFMQTLYDEDRSIADAIERYMQYEVYYAGVKRFTGVITNEVPSKNDSSVLELVGLDYWTFALRGTVNRTFTNKSASEIIIDVVDNELSGLNLTTTGVVATTNIISNDATETKMIYRGNQPISKIFSDLALNEDYIISIDETKDMIFRSNIAVDSGVHLIYGTDIIEEQIQKMGEDLINVVSVKGAPGQPPNTPPVGAIVEDDALIAKYATDDFDGRLPIVDVSRPELATPEACQAAGEAEIRKHNQDPDRGPVTTELSFAVDVNELVTLTIPHRNITAQTFMVQRVAHTETRNTTTLDVIYFTRQTADLVFLVMEQNRNTELYLVDDALVFTKFKKLQENLTLTAYVSVDSRIFSGAEFGEFEFAEKNFGDLSGSFTSEVSDKQITVQNQLFEDWLRIIGQIATVPTLLDGANSFIAIGNDSTAIQVTDTTLTSELYRKPMEAGYPNRGTIGEVSFKGIIDDVDAITATIRNLALFNAAASGNMLLAGVLDADLSKVADQQLDFTIRLILSGVTITAAGIALLLDLLTNKDANYLDNPNAAIELITTPVYRNGMTSGFPKFNTVASDQLIFSMDVDTVAQDGKTFAGMDLYNKTASGTQMLDAALPITTTISSAQNMTIQMLLKMMR